MSKPKLMSCSGAISVVFVVTVVELTAAQSSRNLREQARSGTLKVVGSSAFSDYSPKSIEELTAESEVVLIGTLSREKSYLSPNEEHVCTDYIISDIRLLAGTYSSLSPLPQVTKPPVLTMFGGEMMLEGVPARSISYNFKPLANGRYLLFLKRNGSDAGRYSPYHGGVFALNGEQVIPMLNQSEDIFVGVRHTPASVIISRVEKAAMSR